MQRKLNQGEGLESGGKGGAFFLLMDCSEKMHLMRENWSGDRTEIRKLPVVIRLSSTGVSSG